MRQFGGATDRRRAKPRPALIMKDGKVYKNTVQ
jgi:hypothetical protein